MKIPNKQILCVGELLWDRLPKGAKPGGAPTNVALHLNSIGQDVTLASRIGNDEPGKELVSFLEKSGLNSEFIQVDKSLPTSEVLVHLDENRNASYEICEPVAWDNLESSEPLVERAKKSGLLIYGTLASRNAKTRETILNLLNYNAVKLIDVNFRKPYDSKEVVEKLLEKTDIVKLNDDELVVFAKWYNKQNLDEKKLIKWFVSFYGIKMVCVTRGEKGALLYYDDRFYEHPGFKVKAIDTVGAGDAFLAGLIASLLDNKSPYESLAFACATGAFVASKEGATPRYEIDEINAILNGSE